MVTGPLRKPKHWFLKNSWGGQWADAGYFRVSKEVFEALAPVYHHVYFLEKTLTSKDRKAFKMFQDAELNK